MKVDCDKAKRQAAWLRYAILLLIVAIAAGNVLMAVGTIGPHATGTAFRMTASFSPVLEGHPGLMVMDGVTVSLVFVAGLYQLVRLMRRFEQGEFFSIRAIGHLRAFAQLLLAAVIADCLLPSLLMLAARLVGVQGIRAITFGIDGTDVWMGLVSALFLTITSVMGEARKLAEDQALIV